MEMKKNRKIQNKTKIVSHLQYFLAESDDFFVDLLFCLFRKRQEETGDKKDDNK